MRKKILAIIMAILMLFWCGSFNAFAFNDTKVIIAETDEEYAKCLEELSKDSDKISLFSVVDTDDEFSLKRLIVKSDTLPDICGADTVIKYSGYYLMSFPSTEITEKAYEYYSNDDSIDYVEPDTKIQADVEISTDTGTENAYTSWGYGDEYIGVNDFYDTYKLNDDEVVVAVLDTGADLDHEMLYGRIISGYNYISTSSLPEDDNGHGTHVSGIISEGTPDNVKIMPVKVLDASGDGSISAMNSAIRYAVNKGADVINMSIGGIGKYDENSPTFDALRYAINNGVTVVVAAGNSRQDVYNVIPASFKSAITVAAIDDTFFRDNNSCFGEGVDIAAPGVSIEGAYKDGGYETLSGTSMAAPHVSAAAANILSVNSDLAPWEVETLIKANAKPIEQHINTPIGAGALKLSDFRFEGIALDKTELRIIEGETRALNIDIVSDYNIECKSSDNTVATVNNKGEITGILEGTAIITVSAGDIKKECAVTVFGIGDWYSGNDMKISTPKELIELSRLINSGTDDFYKKTVTIENDIYMGDISWEPIGYAHYTDADKKCVFNGTFDGNLHNISNLNSNIYKVYQGLFGVIGCEGVVKNVNLTDLTIDTINAAGGIAGKNEGKISDCMVYGTIKGSRAYTVNIGGISAENKGIIKGSKFEGTLTSGSTKVDTRYLNEGGAAAINTGVLVGSRMSGEVITGLTGVSIKYDAVTAENNGIVILADKETGLVKTANATDNEIIVSVNNEGGSLNSLKEITEVETTVDDEGFSELNIYIWSDIKTLNPAFSKIVY